MSGLDKLIGRFESAARSVNVARGSIESALRVEVPSHAARQSHITSATNDVRNAVTLLTDHATNGKALVPQPLQDALKSLDELLVTSQQGGQVGLPALNNVQTLLSDTQMRLATDIEVSSILNTSSLETNREQMRTLARIAGGEPTHPLLYLIQGKIDVSQALKRYATPEAALQRATEIYKFPTESLTPDQIHELHGIHNLPDTRRPELLAPNNAIAGYAERGENTMRFVGASPTLYETRRTIIAQSKYHDFVAAFPTTELRNAEVARLLNVPIVDASASEIHTLMAVATHEPALPILESLTPQQLGTIGDHIEQGRPYNTAWYALGVFDVAQARARYTSRDAAFARASELLQTPIADLTPRQLHELHGIHNLPDATRPLPLKLEPDIARVAEFKRTSENIPSNWNVWGVLNNLRNTIVYAKQYPDVAARERALPQLVKAWAGGDNVDRGLLAFLGRQSTDPIARFAAAAAQLEQVTVAGQLPSRYLNDIATVMELLPNSTNSMIQRLSSQTEKLISDNLMRMQGITPDGAMQGYTRYPEFADVGAIRSNLRMLGSLHVQELSSTSRYQNSASSLPLVW